jgi:hypothetical protein
MFWDAPKLPVEKAHQEWIEDSFLWLLRQFGESNFLKSQTILPTQTFFPDKYDRTEQSVVVLVKRVCFYMGINPDEVEVRFFTDQDDTAQRHHLGNEEKYSGAAGLYFTKSSDESKKQIAINVSNFKDPTSLVATIAHELGHVILLGGGMVKPDNSSHEYLTDLTTVFFGLGIFNSNAAFQFSQWQSHSHQGWRASRTGYLSEAEFAYALAAYAWLRGEKKPKWSEHLAMNVGHYFKQSLKYLEKGGETKLRSLV